MIMKQKSICFLFPCFSYGPCGGFKVVYEYANYLASKGYEVTIVYPGLYIPGNFSLLINIKKLLLYALYSTFKDFKQKWFNLDKRIKERKVPILNLKYVGDYDVYVATSVGTAIHLNEFKIPLHKKFYFIQGFENWYVSESVLRSTYCYGFKNIVVSDWLAEEVRKSKADCTIIKNGFDFEYFKLYHKIEDRDRLHISMLNHVDKNKGCKYGIEALELVKQKYPALKATLFGYPQRDKNIPDWIEYYQAPDKKTHNEIYNNSSIYLAPSLQEGWGLTVGEAMICGAAVVCTDTKGFREMVTDGESGLMVPIKNSEALAEAIISLIEDNERRIKLAKNGVKTISNFSWEKSFVQFEKLIES